ncbi:hypothetical protein LSAT2_024802 [Lamellibrachia satsuma]|nr:hypothetical protein LSAT2_024802 [Lamellibrachia satsuma]
MQELQRDRRQPVYQVISGYEHLPQGNQRDRRQPVYQVIPAYEQLVQQNQTDVQQPVYEVIPGYEQPMQTTRSQHHGRKQRQRQDEPRGLQQPSTVSVPASSPETLNTQEPRGRKRKRLGRYCCGFVLFTVVAAIIASVIVIAVVLSEEFKGEVTLDNLEYDKTTYSNLNSPESKTLASDFCTKMMDTLKKGSLGEDAQLCHVDRFTKGSIKVHFTIVVQQFSARDSGKMKKDPADLAMVIKQEIVKEANKKGEAPMTKASPTMTEAPPTRTKSPPTTTGPQEHTTATEVTICDTEQPCKNGGRCIATSTMEYICVCPTCGCLSSPPLTATCDIDTTTICNGVSISTWMLTAFPYDCHKFVNCTGGHFVGVGTIKDNQVFNSVNGIATNPTELTCAVIIEPEICDTNVCKNSGMCVDTQTGYQCSCTFGYIGDKCENETEKCKDNTCENGGSCTNTVTGVDCTCPSNYAGDRCEKEKIPCSDVTCQNGGHCTDTDSGYRCDCPMMFTGVLCETEWKFCERDMPCQNGGTCIDLPEDKYVCVCPKCGCSTAEPFDNCTIDEANICKITNMPSHRHVAHPYSCSKFVDCKAEDGTFVSAGYVYQHEKGNVYNPATGAADYSTNVACSKSADPTPCAADTCANGGTCEDTLSGFKCHCPFGQYNGWNCENALTTCNNVTCQHGTCEDTENGFYCNCYWNYVGTYCQNEKIHCGAANCQNGATCTDTDLGYRCECVIGFTGDKCETDIDDCDPNPCHKDYSDNQCVDKVNGYECNCLSCNCSTVITTIDCQLDAPAECKAAKAAHPGRASFYLAHPYKCDRRSGLKLNEKKCVFGVTELTYLGEKLTHKEVKPDSDKVAGIRNMPVPTTKDEGQRALGMVNFMANVVPNLSVKTTALRHLLLKKNDWQWEAEQAREWQNIKDFITMEPLLKFYDPAIKSKI